MTKLRIGIVGLRFGQYIIDTQIASGEGAPYFELGGVCDLDKAKAQAASSKHNVPSYASLDAMLKDESLSVIGLYTPPAGRADMVRSAIRAGKHVMTTKPFELDPTSAADLLREVRASGRVVHINSPSPLCPADLAKIMEWRERYALGRAVSAEYATWANYHEQPDGSWYDDPRRCPVAPIMRLGIYGINDLVRLLGPADTVQVMHSRIRTGRPTPDNANMTIRFRSGAIGSVFASFCIDDGKPYRNALRISYERGTVYCNFSPTAEDSSNVHLELVMRRGSGAEVVERFTIPGTARSGEYQWEALYRAAHGASLPDEVEPEQIVAGVAIIAAMAKAEASGRIEPVEMPEVTPKSHEAEVPAGAQVAERNEVGTR